VRAHDKTTSLIIFSFWKDGRRRCIYAEGVTMSDEGLKKRRREKNREQRTEENRKSEKRTKKRKEKRYGIEKEEKIKDQEDQRSKKIKEYRRRSKMRFGEGHAESSASFKGEVMSIDESIHCLRYR